jgi:hypothetical protein
MAATRPLPNGNGNMVRPTSRDVEEEEDENIFLFYPNLIGMHSIQLPNISQLIKPTNRLLPRRPRRSLALLHAPPPTHMLAPILDILPARRARRARRPPLPAIDKVRRCPGHGDGPLHDGVPARVPGVSIPPVEHRVPGADQLGPGEPLHAHVRDAEHGRRRAESQERG